MDDDEQRETAVFNIVPLVRLRWARGKYTCSCTPKTKHAIAFSSAGEERKGEKGAKSVRCNDSFGNEQQYIQQTASLENI